MCEGVKVAIIACEWCTEAKAMDFNLQVYALVDGVKERGMRRRTNLMVNKFTRNGTIIEWRKNKKIDILNWKLFF